MTRGICYVAYGENARSEAAMSIRSLRIWQSSIPVSVISDTPADGAKHIPFDDPRYGARWAKLNLDLLSPYDTTLYLDADTRPRADLAPLFAPLDAGYDLVLAPSTQQADKALWHVEAQEREATFDTFGFTPLQLQAGVLAFRKCEAVTALFAAWRDEWCGSEHPTQDQAALLRALYRVPVKLWLISSILSDQLVLHLFGKAKAK